MIAVWGANGFIGRHFVKELVTDGNDVVALSRRFDGFDFNSGVKTFEANFCDVNAYAGILSSCDTIVFLVTQSLSRTFDDIEQEINKNVTPYCTVFDLLKHQKHKPHIVYVSSGGAIYGECSDCSPISENHPLNPVSVYGHGKAMIERALISASNEGGFTYTIIRPSNPVGEGGRNLISYALDAIKKDQTFKVYGDGSAVRDYFNVSDLAIGLSLVSELPVAQNKIYNLGSGRGVSINDVLKLIEKVTHRRIRKQYVDAPMSDVAYNVLDCKKAYSDLNWSAQISLENTIIKMWKDLCEF